jgi:hypothetical protein
VVQGNKELKAAARKGGKTENEKIVEYEKKIALALEKASELKREIK